MRKKTRYSEATKEKVIAFYLSCGNLCQTAETFKIPKSTVKVWIDKEPPEDIKQIRTENKQRFAEKAWEPINNAMELLNREIKVSLEKQQIIEDAIAEIESLTDNEMKYQERVTAIKSLSKMARMDLRELTTAIGTLYDKQALAKGESTNNTNVTMTAEEKSLLEKVSKRLGK